MIYTVNTEKKLPYWIGNTFYKLDRSLNFNNTFYEATCPCCQGETKITAIGRDGQEYFVDCPVCVEAHGSKYSINSYIQLNNYEVNKYHVHEVNLSNDVVAFDIKQSYAKYVTLHAFCNTRFNDYFTVKITQDNSNMIDRNLDDLESKLESIVKEGDTSKYIFSNKDDANKFLQIVRDYDKKRLEEFNKKYNTSYKYPY